MILKEAQKILNNPVQIEIGSSRKAVETIDQRAIRTKSSRKLAILERILKAELENDGTVIVFCNTKRAVRLVDRELWAKNFSVAALSGDHEQSVRFKVMERFRKQEIRVLIATDVAARGLDIDHIGHVINFDCPFEVEDYVHRIGRTARAGRDGTVTTFIGDEDYQSFARVKNNLEQDIAMLDEYCNPQEQENRRPKKSAPSAKPEQDRSEQTKTGDDSRDDSSEKQSRRPRRSANSRSNGDQEQGEKLQTENGDENQRPRRGRRRRNENSESQQNPETSEQSGESRSSAPSQSDSNRESEESDGRRPRRARGRGRRNQERTRESDKHSRKR